MDVPPCLTLSSRQSAAPAPEKNVNIFQTPRSPAPRLWAQNPPTSGRTARSVSACSGPDFARPILATAPRARDSRDHARRLADPGFGRVDGDSLASARRLRGRRAAALERRRRWLELVP